MSPWSFPTRRCPNCLIAVSAALWIAPLVAYAGESNAADALESAGLRKIGTYWVLPGEKDLAEGLKALKPLERNLNQAIKLRGDYDKHIAKNRAGLQAAIAERRRLNVLLVQADDRDDAAKIVQRMNQLASQIDAVVQYVNDPGPGEEIDRRIGEAADALYAEVRKLRENADATAKRYEELASDSDVQARMTEQSDATKRTFKLGPRRVFLKNLSKLAEYESAIQSEDIALKKRGGVFIIEAIINDRARADFVFDTGASLVLLPTELARRAGLIPSDADPTIRMQVADGRTVDGRLMFIDELRVGAFSAKNVECAILPPEMGDVEPLLGGSFLRNFSINLNHAAGTLTLTKIKTTGKSNAGLTSSYALRRTNS